MTIASQTSRINYTGDGVTTTFAVPFYFQADADLIVYLLSPAGVGTLQVLGTNYAVTGTGVSTGGTCSFTVAPTTGYTITIYRDPPLTQTTSYNNNDPFPAKSHELALDKLTTLEQRTRDLVVRTPALVTSDIDGSGRYDFKGNRGINAGTPVSPTDVATKAYADSVQASAQIGQIADGAITNAKLALAPAWTIKANATSGSASPTDLDITALATKANPIFTDVVLIQDSAAGNAFKKTSIGGISSTFAARPDGRPTLTSGVPVMTTSVSASTLLYYDGYSYPYYNGTSFVPKFIATELVTSTTDTAKSPAAIGASKINDWFLWEDTATFTVTIASPAVLSYTAHGFVAGAPFTPTTTGALPTGMTAGTTYFVISTGLTSNTFQFAATVGGSAIVTTGVQSGTHTITAQRHTHGPDWTSDTARSAGTSLTLVNGIYLNTNAITNGPAALRGTYVTTTRSNSGSTLDYNFGAIAAGVTPANFGVWSVYNRVHVCGLIGDTVANWTYSTATTWRAANGLTSWRVNFVRGLSVDSQVAEYVQIGIAGALTSMANGIGYDSTTAFTGSTGFYNAPTLASMLIAKCSNIPAIGYHYYQAIEYNSTTTASTWEGQNAAFPVGFQTALHYSLWM